MKKNVWPSSLNLKIDQNPGLLLEIFQHIRQILYMDCLLLDSFADKSAGAIIDIQGIAAFLPDQPQVEVDIGILQVLVDLGGCPRIAIFSQIEAF